MVEVAERIEVIVEFFFGGGGPWVMEMGKIL